MNFILVKKRFTVFLVISSIVNAQNNYEKGNKYLNNGDLTNALIEFSAGIIKNPYDWKLYQARAYTNEQSQNFEEALNDANKALELNPRQFNLSSLFTRGRILLKKGDYVKAIEDFSYLIQYFPNDFQNKIGIFHLNRAKSYLYSNQKNNACIDFLESRKRKMSDAQHFIDKFCN